MTASNGAQAAAIKNTPGPARTSTVVGVGVEGMRFLQGTVPETVKLVAISPEGPLPDGLEEVEFIVLSPRELRKRFAEIFQRATSLKVVQTLSAGVDPFLPHAPPHVLLCNAGGVKVVGVSEWCVAAILAMQRRFAGFWQAQQERRWDEATMQMIQRKTPDVGLMDDLEDKVVLILGMGSIGSAVASRLAPFGPKVIGITRTTHADGTTRPPSDLPELLPTADVVVVLLPLTPETERIVDAKFLASMKPDALLVNAGRGKLVDTDALVQALHEGRVRAALDVTDPEPLPSDHPLWGAPGVFITPHVAAAVPRDRVRGYDVVRRQLKRFMAGEPLLNVKNGRDY